MELEKLKYPIGKFTKPELISEVQIHDWINVIKDFPLLLKKEVTSLSEAELNWHYRPEGWTIGQLVHHCADSHMNGFIRHKLTLTEEEPTIKPYAEYLWAKQIDVEKAPIANSLLILEGLHARWFMLLEAVTKKDLARTYIHPEHNKIFTLEESIGAYAWHCHHHFAHIRQAKEFKGKG